jgi:hypothetical protein
VFFGNAGRSLGQDRLAQAIHRAEDQPNQAQVGTFEMFGECMIRANCHFSRTASYGVLLGIVLLAIANASMGQAVPLSPTALAASADGKMVYVACATGQPVLCFDIANRKVSASISVPESPSGLVLSPDNTRLLVTCAAPESKVCIINLKNKRVVETVTAGHTAMAPVLGPGCQNTVRLQPVQQRCERY